MSSSSDADDMLVFEDWMKEHNKTYTCDDEMHGRFKIFQQSLRKIENHNSSLPRPRFCLKLTPFSAMTDEEFRSEFFVPKSERHLYFSSSSDDDDEEFERRANLRKIYADKKHDTKQDVTPPPPVTVRRQTRGGDEKQDTKEDVTPPMDPEPKKPKN